MNICESDKSCPIFVIGTKSPCSSSSSNKSSKSSCNKVVLTELDDNNIIKEKSLGPDSEITTPNGMTFDKYDNLYIVNQKPPQIFKLSKENKVSILGQFPSSSMLKNITIDSCNNIYVTDCCCKSIYKISNYTKVLNNTDIPTPFDLAYDEQSKSVYVTNTSNILYRVSCKGDVTCFELEKCARYTGIIIDCKRRLFMADKVLDKIVVIDNLDNEIFVSRDFTKNSYLDGPTYMTQDRYCNIYVVNNSSKCSSTSSTSSTSSNSSTSSIVKVDSLGFQVLYSSSIENPTGIATRI